MPLDRNCINYHYRLGRLVAVIEAIEKPDLCFSSRVFDNAGQKLRPLLDFAMKNSGHVLSKELFELAPVGLNERKLPFESIGNTNHGTAYWLGYHHEKSYIEKNFAGCLGIVKTEVEHHIPERIEAPAIERAAIEELRR